MTIQPLPCAICGRLAEGELTGSLRRYFACYWCGQYVTAESFPSDVRRDPDGEKLLPYLAAHVRQTYDRQSTIVSVGPDWKLEAGTHANTTLAQKTRMLLE